MDLLDRLDAMIDERRLLTHPFYTKWVVGTLPATPSAAARRAVLENLWDEEHGEDNHAELWLRFAEGMGLRREEVAGAKRNAATDALVETYRRASTSSPVAGLAAVHAYERQGA